MLQLAVREKNGGRAPRLVGAKVFSRETGGMTWRFVARPMKRQRPAKSFGEPSIRRQHSVTSNVFTHK